MSEYTCTEDSDLPQGYSLIKHLRDLSLTRVRMLSSGAILPNKKYDWKARKPEANREPIKILTDIDPELELMKHQARLSDAKLNRNIQRKDQREQAKIWKQHQ